MMILSRAALLDLVKSEPKKHKAIVIYEPGQYELVKDIVDNCESALTLEMDDTTVLREGSPTKAQVELAILSNIKIVCCKQGISRSSAIAFLIESNTTSPEEAIKILDERKHFPNELILKHGLDILGDKIKKSISGYYQSFAKNKGWQVEMVTKYFRNNDESNC